MPAFESGRFLSAGDRVLLAELPAGHHLTGALRVRGGEPLVLFHQGELYDTIVEELPGGGLAAVVRSARPSPLAATPMVLVQAVIRPALLDDVIRLVTPLGVCGIVLFVGERSQPWNVAGRMGRLRDVAQAAAEQSETGIVPVISLENSLAAALGRSDLPGHLVAMSPRGDRSLSSLCGSAGLGSAEGVGLVVGPEGGLSEGEERTLDSRGVYRAHLNTGVLRSELAGFAGFLIVREMQGLS